MALSSIVSHRVGLISDTHGLLRPGVHEAFAGVEIILHSGDVGGNDVLDELRLIAPVLAVAGNTDLPGEYAGEVNVLVGALSVHVSHGHELGAPTPQKLAEAYSADVIVYGHTHRPLVTRVGGKLIVNPGAAGARRFNLLPSVAILTIADGKAEAEIIELR